MFSIKVLIVCAVVVFAAVVGSAIFLHSLDKTDLLDEEAEAIN